MYVEQYGTLVQRTLERFAIVFSVPGMPIIDYTATVV